MAESEYARVARSQRMALRRMANLIEQGKPLENDMQRRFAAEALRAFAAEIPDEPPKKRGQQPKFNHAMAAVEFDFFSKTLRSENAAIEKLAAQYGVSVQAMRKALKKYRQKLEEEGNLNWE